MLKSVSGEKKGPSEQDIYFSIKCIHMGLNRIPDVTNFIQRESTEGLLGRAELRSLVAHRIEATAGTINAGCSRPELLLSPHGQMTMQYFLTPHHPSANKVNSIESAGRRTSPVRKITPLSPNCYGKSPPRKYIKDTTRLGLSPIRPDEPSDPAT
jgi:hypothetical protein